MSTTVDWGCRTAIPPAYPPMEHTAPLSTSSAVCALLISDAHWCKRPRVIRIWPASSTIIPPPQLLLAHRSNSESDSSKLPPLHSMPAPVKAARHSVK
eukprot:124622-Prymnesium_polylepis.2